MLRQIFYILLLTFTLAIFAEEPQTPPQLSKEEIIKQWMQKNNIPGVAVVLYQGGKLQQYYFGYREIIGPKWECCNQILYVGLSALIGVTLAYLYFEKQSTNTQA